MAVQKPVKVPEKKVSSTDVVSFDGGLDQRGDENAAPNTFVSSRNVTVTLANLITHRPNLKRWLPDTVGTVYQIFPALYNGVVYYVTADDGKIKYCEAGDTTWTDATGSNTITTTGVINTFLRIKDKLLILNGADKLQYLDLSNMQVVKFTAIADPTNQPAVAGNNITVGSGNHKIYYAINWNSTVGQTAASPIYSGTIDKSRQSWKTDGTEYLTITNNNTPPAGATSWNIWVSLAASGATIHESDMLLLASGLDIATTKFVDNGTISIDLTRGTAPEDNSTDGMKATYGVEDRGRPMLYGNPDSPHSIYIGGDGDNALDFTPTNGGYEMRLNVGTNFYPKGVIGFRNGQGIPSMTVLFSNTQGLAKQTIIEQKTITYGNTSFVVWASTEQNYGAAGVSSPYCVVNYLGSLIFFTTDGIVSMDTEASMQNVLSTKRISDKAYKTVGSIKNSALPNIVGTAWANKIYMSIASKGYTSNNEILVYDMVNPEKPKWYSYEIASQWVGTVSPQDERAFVYVCQGNHIYRLEEGYVALDENSDGTTSAFPVTARGSLIGTNQAHNSYVAVVQAMFYLLRVIGEVNIGVTYRNDSGDIKTVTKTVNQGVYTKSSGGGWSSPSYLYSVGESSYEQWGDFPAIADADIAVKVTTRVPIPIDDLVSEMQWFISTNLDNSSFILRSVSYEGVNVGVKGDLV